MAASAYCGRSFFIGARRIRARLSALGLLIFGNISMTLKRNYGPGIPGWDILVSLVYWVLIRTQRPRPPKVPLLRVRWSFLLGGTQGVLQRAACSLFFEVFSELR